MANTQRGSFRRNGSVLARHRELNPPVRGQSPGFDRLWRVTSDACFLARYDARSETPVQRTRAMALIPLVTRDAVQPPPDEVPTPTQRSQ